MYMYRTRIFPSIFCVLTSFMANLNMHFYLWYSIHFWLKLQHFHLLRYFEWKVLFIFRHCNFDHWFQQQLWNFHVCWWQVTIMTASNAKMNCKVFFCSFFYRKQIQTNGSIMLLNILHLRKYIRQMDID